jgi:hypothetical protein
MTTEDVKSWKLEAYAVKDETGVGITIVDRERLEGKVYPDFDFSILFGLENGEWTIVSQIKDGATKREVALMKNDKVIVVPVD